MIVSKSLARCIASDIVFKELFEETTNVLEKEKTENKLNVRRQSNNEVFNI